jgi:hypothetical protein
LGPRTVPGRTQRRLKRVPQYQHSLRTVQLEFALAAAVESVDEVDMERREQKGAVECSLAAALVQGASAFGARGACVL